ncbi:HTTM domain-containing protein [Flavobacterium psychrophilum]|uniref:HTTM domain-containing protein n=1 Tax=Flavobacterium psychrophilum TaxID=96345 RepID=A0A7U2NG04_FLAPS|nr:HTTM domain-containing protein [Flavobacterium psychrophilum]EKT4550159.1 HTTM domain-containing protein [Flavobacterium psychrophilum]ELV7524685.1 HTTM domain-containing protein [Flavobacterium psychrophilum]MCB6230908.1 HTTM domain-containing protein [Flavobacterium psychrophilum]OJH13662.1 restriction endonuclease subunit S [Flavobacterium psychrophilum]QRE04469.1 HTTM domain-containing protein [Flavobacterium psychrophilum]
MNKPFDKKIGITILRVVLGIVILKDFINYFFNRNFLFNNKSIVSYETYLDITKHYNLNWLYIDFNNPDNTNIFCIIAIAFSLLFTLGVLKKLSTLLIFFLLFIFKIRVIYLIDGGDNVISVLLPFLFFTDSYSLIDKYEQFSQRIKSKYESYFNITSVLFSFAIMFQICIIYFFAALHKLSGQVWQDGTAIYYILNSEDFSASTLNFYLTKPVWLVYFFTWFTILFQFTFPFLVWVKKTKNIMLLIGVLFHLGIFFLMRIDNFSLVMLACYAIFLSDNEYKNINKKIQSKIFKND